MFSLQYPFLDVCATDVRFAVLECVTRSSEPSREDLICEYVPNRAVIVRQSVALDAW